MSRQDQHFRNIIVESVIFLDSADPPRWKGCLQLSAEHRPIDILIFNIQGQFRAVPALCAHEGYDLTHCALINENTFVCPAHSQHTDLKASSFQVQERNGQFLVSLNKNASGNEDSETIIQLREEIDKLRLANLKQQKQIQVIAQSMDAMLSESEQQKLKLQDKANQQQVLTRFVDRVMDTIDDLLFIIDTEGRIRRLNTAVERELGFSEAELLATGIDGLLSPIEQQDLAGHLPALPWPVRSVLLETVRLNGCYAGEHELVGKKQNPQKSI